MHVARDFVSHSLSVCDTRGQFRREIMAVKSARILQARLLQADKAAPAGIDDKLSWEIVADRRDREGSMVWPWLHTDPIAY